MAIEWDGSARPDGAADVRTAGATVEKCESLPQMTGDLCDHAVRRAIRPEPCWQPPRFSPEADVLPGDPGHGGMAHRRMGRFGHPAGQKNLKGRAVVLVEAESDSLNLGCDASFQAYFTAAHREAAVPAVCIHPVEPAFDQGRRQSCFDRSGQGRERPAAKLAPVCKAPSVVVFRTRHRLWTRREPRPPFSRA